MSFAIHTDALAKSFGTVKAVAGVSLEVERGQMFALVGPDGAGKTTTIRMLCGILRPDSGAAHLLGFDVLTQAEEIKRRIGYLSQRFSLYTDLSIDENIEFFARINGVKDFRKRREELLEFTRLGPFRTRLADKLSGGMKQKLALACTLIHTPEIIFLDEPTTGVDPVTRRDFWKLLAELMKGGTTIMLTTPYLDEAERCTRVAMMNQGAILACDVPAALKNSLGQKVIEVLCSPSRRAFGVAQGNAAMKAFFDDIQIFGDRLDFIYTAGADADANDLIRNVLVGAGITIVEARTKSPTLENVFITLIERARAAAGEPEEQGAVQPDVAEQLENAGTEDAHE
ncbi:MAG TPA: ABC transporter ATP-binding protein [Candidatus Kapabacteria bacterium]|nr:ABC transporter ATP-binding protein [Candidatus Kapabacteria bacterium]